MSDPKPYTMNECPVWHGTVASVHLGRVRATVEALEQARRERDEARASATRGWKQADSLHLTVAEVADERDALKAALRETLEVVEGETCGECGLDLAECECDGSAWWRRAREALKEAKS